MAVAFLFREWSHNCVRRSGEQNNRHDLNDRGIKANVVRAKQFGDGECVGMFHDGGSGKLFAQFAVAERRRKQNVDNSESQKDAANFIDAERETGQVKDQAFYDRGLVWRRNKIGRHWDTHNLHKTRYKSGSNSTEPVSAMKSKGLGKLVKDASISFENNDIS